MKKIIQIAISLLVCTMLILAFNSCGAAAQIHLKLEKSEKSDFSKLKALRIIIREQEKNPEIFGPFEFNKESVKLEAFVTPGTPFHVDVWGCGSIDNCEPEHLLARGCSGIETVRPSDTTKIITITVFELAKEETDIPVCPFKF